MGEILDKVFAYGMSNQVSHPYARGPPPPAGPAGDPHQGPYEGQGTRRGPYRNAPADDSGHDGGSAVGPPPAQESGGSGVPRGYDGGTAVGRPAQVHKQQHQHSYAQPPPQVQKQEGDEGQRAGRDQDEEPGGPWAARAHYSGQVSPFEVDLK